MVPGTKTEMFFTQLFSKGRWLQYYAYGICDLICAAFVWYMGFIILGANEDYIWLWIIWSWYDILCYIIYIYLYIYMYNVLFYKHHKLNWYEPICSWTCLEWRRFCWLSPASESGLMWGEKEVHWNQRAARSSCTVTNSTKAIHGVHTCIYKWYIGNT